MSWTSTDQLQAQQLADTLDRYTCNRCGHEETQAMQCMMCGWGDLYPVREKMIPPPGCPDDHAPAQRKTWQPPGDNSRVRRARRR
jgi:hypothetical protein